MPVCSEDGDKGKRKKWTLDAEEGNRGKGSKNGRKLKKKISHVWTEQRETLKGDGE